jgi:hypothetical protein
MGSGSVRTQKANNTVSVCAASNCLSSLQASPACADDSWSLWNATDSPFEFGFFCCLVDQAGLATGSCIAASQVPAYKNQIGVLARHPLRPLSFYNDSQRLTIPRFPSRLDFSCNRNGYNYVVGRGCDWGWIIGYQHGYFDLFFKRDSFTDE